MLSLLQLGRVNFLHIGSLICTEPLLIPTGGTSDQICVSA